VSAQAAANAQAVGLRSHSGSLCLARVLDIDQQRMLLDAMRSKLTVLPYYKLGNGGARCLVAFSFVANKSAVPDITK